MIHNVSRKNSETYIWLQLFLNDPLSEVYGLKGPYLVQISIRKKGAGGEVKDEKRLRGCGF